MTRSGGMSALVVSSAVHGNGMVATNQDGNERGTGFRHHACDVGVLNFARFALSEEYRIDFGTLVQLTITTCDSGK